MKSITLSQARCLVAALALVTLAPIATAAGIVRHPIGSDFPIASAVEVPADFALLRHSGMTPRPADPTAERGTRAFWGDTRTQTLSVFGRILESLEAKGMGLGDIVKMTVFLVGDPELNDQMDFLGFMEAYTQFFGTFAQPALPARSVVQVQGLVADGMMVEIEVIAARPR